MAKTIGEWSFTGPDGGWLKVALKVDVRPTGAVLSVEPWPGLVLKSSDVEDLRRQVVARIVERTGLTFRPFYQVGAYQGLVTVRAWLVAGPYSASDGRPLWYSQAAACDETLAVGSGTDDLRILSQLTGLLPATDAVRERLIRLQAAYKRVGAKVASARVACQAAEKGAERAAGQAAAGASGEVICEVLTEAIAALDAA